MVKQNNVSYKILSVCAFGNYLKVANANSGAITVIS